MLSLLVAVLIDKDQQPCDSFMMSGRLATTISSIFIFRFICQLFAVFFTIAACLFVCLFSLYVIHLSHLIVSYSKFTCRIIILIIFYLLFSVAPFFARFLTLSKTEIIKKNVPLLNTSTPITDDRLCCCCCSTINNGVHPFAIMSLVTSAAKPL